MFGLSSVGAGHAALDAPWPACVDVLEHALARAPSKLTMFVLHHFMIEPGKWRAFLAKGQLPMHLRPGDRISATIRTEDGRTNLGEHSTAAVMP